MVGKVVGVGVGNFFWKSSGGCSHVRTVKKLRKINFVRPGFEKFIIKIPGYFLLVGNLMKFRRKIRWTGRK